MFESDDAVASFFEIVASEVQSQLACSRMIELQREAQSACINALLALIDPCADAVALAKTSK